MNISGIDLNLLPVFDALFTERSVTRAATKVGLSQPALSNALTRLRTCFRDELFVRIRGAMVPTPRAMQLAPDIQAALSQFQSVLERPPFRPENVVRHFRLATTDEVELILLPAVMKELRSIAPGVTISCTRLQGISRVPDADLQLGTLDGAIGIFPTPAPLESERMAVELYRPNYVCLVRNGHPTVKAQLTLKQFCQLDHVETHYPGEGPALIDRLLAQRGYKRSVKLSLPHFLPIPFVVADSDLIATVPLVVARAVAQPRLRYLKCPVSLPPIPVSLVWHSRTDGDPSHKWFRSIILRVSENLPVKLPCP